MGINKSNIIALVIVLVSVIILYIASMQYPQNVISKIGAYIEIDSGMTVKQINEILGRYDYDVPPNTGNTDSRIIYVMSNTLNNNKIMVNKYRIKNKDTLSLSFPRDTLVIISLHANATIPYTWSFLKGTGDKEIMKHIDTKGMISPVHDKPEPGVNNDRVNYYFETVENGNCLLQFHYDRTDTDNYKPDEFYFDLKVQVQ